MKIKTLIKNNNVYLVAHRLFDCKKRKKRNKIIKQLKKSNIIYQIKLAKSINVIFLVVPAFHRKSRRIVKAFKQTSEEVKTIVRKRVEQFKILHSPNAKHFISAI